MDDDTPDPVNDLATVEEGGGSAVNLLIVLDVSGSMGFNPDVPGYATRLALAKDALENLINSGNVNAVQLVTFDSDGHTHGGWMSAAAAISAINGLGIGSGTDYDAALRVLDANYTSPPPGGSQTIMYFVSDGEPTENDIGNDPTPTFGIDGTEETAFLQFLTDNGISQSIAVGIGNGVSTTALEPLAFPGNAIAVNDENDLIGTIAGTLPGSVTGNVLDNDGFGADGLREIASVKVGNDLYTYDEAGNDIYKNGGLYQADTSVLEVTTALGSGGKLTFYFTGVTGHPAGDWQYLSPQSGVNTAQQEVFTYVIVDGDGDGQSAQLIITVEPSAVPTITGDGTQDVFEAGLPPRGLEPAGSAEAADGNPNNNTNTTEAVSGTFTIASPDGLTSITITPDGGDAPVTITLAAAACQLGLAGHDRDRRRQARCQRLQCRHRRRQLHLHAGGQPEPYGRGHRHLPDHRDRSESRHVAGVRADGDDQ